MPNIKITFVFVFPLYSNCDQSFFLCTIISRNNCGVAQLELPLQPKGARFNFFFELLIFFHKQWMNEKNVFLGQLAWGEGELAKFPKFLGENKICNYPLRANGPKFLKNIWLFGKYGPKTWFFKANGLKFIEETWFH
jgi:hypothetical protein